MREAIKQEYDYGCGIACFAFATNQSYRTAADYLGTKQAQSKRFWCKDFVAALNNYGLDYTHHYLTPRLRKRIYQEGTIILIRRSKHYPAGHYLIRHCGMWMDPWINLSKDNHMENAQAGFRKRLPGQAMYALLPGTKTLYITST